MHSRGLFARKPFVAALLSMLIAAILPLVFGLSFYHKADQVVQSQQDDLATRTLTLCMQSLDESLREIITRSFELRTAFSADHLKPSEEQSTADRLHVRGIFDTLACAQENANPWVEALFFTDSSTDYSVTNCGICDDSMLLRRYFPDGNLEMLHALRSIYIAGALKTIGNTPLFILTVNGSRKSGFAQNQLVAVLKRGYFASWMQKHMTLNASIRLLDNTGTVLSSSGGEVRGPMFRTFSSIGNYTLEMTVSDAIISAPTQQLTRQYWTMLTVSLLLELLVCSWLARRTTLPIQELTDYIRLHARSQDDQGQGLLTIRSAIDSLLAEREQQQRSLLQFQSQQRAEELTRALQGLAPKGQAAWKDCAYVLCVVADDSACTELSWEDKAQLLRCAATSLQAMTTQVSLHSGQLILLLYGQEQAIATDPVKQVLEQLLTALDDAGWCACAALSNVHLDPTQTAAAYREACMAMDALRLQDEQLIECYETARCVPEYYLRDWQHLDKQMRFSKFLSTRCIDEAAMLLDELFPDMLIHDDMALTEMSHLHLDALKYQFLHDMDALLQSEPDHEDLIKDITGQILQCSTHAQLKNLMHSLLNDFSTEEKEPPGSEYLIPKVKAYVRDHACDPQLTVSSIAAIFSMPANALSKLFSRKAEMGVLHYIHKIRIEMACNLLLQQPEITVNEISALVGYASVLTFNRAFKSRYHMPPGEYRKMERV